MSEPFIGQIMMFGGNFAPRGWALCNGQLLPIAQNTALFSILGTTYGGNGQTTFALPNLQGRVAIHPGQSPGTSPYTLGETAGTEQVTLLSNQIPPHNHPLMANSGNAEHPTPTNNVLATATDSQGGTGLTYAASANTTMAPNAIGPNSGGQPFSVVQPFQCVNFIIALEGIFPSRN
jgi:microcystin-dependent protein